MNIRRILSWVFAVPMFLCLLFFLLEFSYFLYLVVKAFTGTISYSEMEYSRTTAVYALFYAHLLYLGAYYIYPPFFQARLYFLSILLHSKLSFVIGGILYIATFFRLLPGSGYI
jgi:hypothetical protein